MELKRIVANNSKSALQSVRNKYGDDALILSTNKLGKRTELIYAIESEISVDSNAVPAKSTEEKRFSELLLSPEKVSESRNPEIRLLLQEIQTELNVLKTSINQNVKSEILSSNEVKGEKELTRQCLKQRIESLKGKAIAEQWNWSGVQLFIGTNCSGKSRFIMDLSKSLCERVSRKPIMIVDLHESRSQKSDASWLGFLDHEMPESSVLVHVNNLEQMGALIRSAKNEYDMLIDANDLRFGSDERINLLPKNLDINVNYCIRSDFSATRLHELCEENSSILTSVVIISDDLDRDMEELLTELSERKAIIASVRHTLQ